MEAPDRPDPGPPEDTPRRVPLRAARIALRWARAATETRSLVVLAIAVRLLAAWTSPAILNDSVSLLRGAERLLAEGPRAVLALPHHPLPPLLYALGATLGAPELAAVLLGAVASGSAVWPLHSLARRACGRHAAVATCLLYSVLPKAVAAGAVPLAEGLFLPFFLGSLALAAGARDAGPRMGRRLLGAGLFAALAFLCRPEGLIAFPAALAAATLDGRPGKLRRGALVAVAFLPLALGYVTALSLDRDALTLSPKKDVARFVGARAPLVGAPAIPAPVAAPEATDARVPTRALDVAKGVARALESALTVPVAILVLIGLVRPRRWRRRRARRPRLLLAGTALLLVLLLARLQAGWGYAGGRHALAAATLLLVFAGQGVATFGAVLPRVTSRRRLTIVFAVLLAIPLGARAVLRPPGEGGVAARRLGVSVAVASFESGRLRIASSAEPLVAYYAHRAHQAQGGADDVPLWGRFVRPLERGAPLDDVAAALAAELSEDVDWIVLDVEPPRAGERASATRRLAAALAERGVTGTPTLAAGSALAAFPVVPR